jgi:hypothetical protein
MCLMQMLFFRVCFFQFLICDDNERVMEYTVPSTSAFPLCGIVCLWAGLSEMWRHVVTKVRSLSETSRSKMLIGHHGHQS